MSSQCPTTPNTPATPATGPGAAFVAAAVTWQGLAVKPPAGVAAHGQRHTLCRPHAIGTPSGVTGHVWGQHVGQRDAGCRAQGADFSRKTWESRCTVDRCETLRNPARSRRTYGGGAGEVDGGGFKRGAVRGIYTGAWVGSCLSVFWRQYRSDAVHRWQRG